MYLRVFFLIPLLVLLLVPLRVRAEPGRVVLEAPPGTRVSLDGRDLGTMVADRPLEFALPDGSGQRLVMRLGSRKLGTVLRLAPGETLKIKADIAAASLERTLLTADAPRRAEELTPRLQALAPLAGKAVPAFSQAHGVKLKPDTTGTPDSSAPTPPPAAVEISGTAHQKDKSHPPLASWDGGRTDWRQRLRQLAGAAADRSRDWLDRARQSLARIDFGNPTRRLAAGTRQVRQWTRRSLSGQWKRFQRWSGLERPPAAPIPLAEKIAAIQVHARYKTVTDSPTAATDSPTAAADVRARAEACEDAGDYAAAAHWYGLARQADPANAWLAYHEADCLGRSGQADAGLRLAVEALPRASPALQARLRRQIAQLHYRRGCELRDAGHLQKALLDFHTAERMLPGIDAENGYRKELQARISSQAQR